MKEEPIKSPIQAEDLAQEKLEDSMESVMEKSGEKDTDVFISAFLKAMRGPKGEKGDKGDKGKDYVLTELDKKAITNMVYSMAQDRMDADVENVVSDVLAIMESKVPDAVKKEFEQNRGSIEKQVTDHFNKIVAKVRDENKQIMGQVMEVIERTKSDIKQDTDTVDKKLNKFWSSKQKELKPKEESVEKIIEKIRGALAWSDLKDRPNIISGLAHLVDVAIDSEPANGASLVYNSATKVWEAGAPSGGGLTEVAVTGTIDDSNDTFTCTTEPTYVVINGVWYKDTGGVYTWSWSANTLTLSGPIGTGSVIWAFA